MTAAGSFIMIALALFFALGAGGYAEEGRAVGIRGASADRNCGICAILAVSCALAGWAMVAFA